MTQQRKINTGGYQLPDNPEPGTHLSVCVDVPDDVNHIRAFLGQIDMLGYWWTWERDSERTGTRAARVWRGIADCVRWRMDNCTGCGQDDAIYRWVEGRLEKSFDGGVTWVNADSDDPRFNAPIFTPLPPGQPDTRCDAARNGRDTLEAAVNQLADDLNANSGLVAVIGAIIAVLLVIGIITTGGAATPVILAFAAALIELGASGLLAAFTPAIYDKYRCILYCHLISDEDTAFTPDTWQMVRDDVTATIVSPAALVINHWLYVIGPAGLTNSTRFGTNVGTVCPDCPTCDWCYNFDFALNNGGWQVTTADGYDNGAWGTGGWGATDHVNTVANPDDADRAVYIERSFNARTITRITLVYDFMGGSYDNSNLRAIFVAVNGVDRGNVLRADMVDGGGQTFIMAGSWTGSNLRVFLRSSRDITSPYSYSGSAVLRSVQIEGVGTNPFGGGNC